MIRPLKSDEDRQDTGHVRAITGSEPASSANKSSVLSVVLELVHYGKDALPSPLATYRKIIFYEHDPLCLRWLLRSPPERFCNVQMLRGV